jgi:hypothetical protein
MKNRMADQKKHALHAGRAPAIQKRSDVMQVEKSP